MFQFTIRDLFWLTVVVAFAVLWGGEIRQRQIDSAEIWEQNRLFFQERDYAITLLAAEYQERSRCDPVSARTKAEGRVAAFANQQRVR